MNNLEEFIKELDKLLTVDISHSWASELYLLNQKDYQELKEKYNIESSKKEDKYCTRCGKKLGSITYSGTIPGMEFDETCEWCEDCFNDFLEVLKGPRAFKDVKLEVEYIQSPETKKKLKELFNKFKNEDKV